MRAGRSTLVKLSLAAASIVISFALAEGLVRLFFPHTRDHVLPGRVFEIDQNLGWRLRPGAETIHASRYFRARYNVNAFGFRDTARVVEKRGVAHRALLYGDSQAFGWGVPAKRRFSDLAEARLDGLEIWNLAVPGYGLDQEVLSFEQSGDRFEADEAMLLVNTDTLSRLYYDRIYKKNKPRFELDSSGIARLVPIRGGASALESIAYESLSGFYLPYFVERQLPALLGEDEPRAAEVGPLERAVLERACAKAAASDLLLTLLVSLPASRDQAKHDLQSFASEKGIGYVEIGLPAAPELIFGPDDRHWNERANALIADQLATALEPRLMPLNEPAPPAPR